MEQIERFDLEGAENMRIRIPRKIQTSVEDFFYDHIRYQKGITLKDAYLHCAQKAIQAYKNDSAVFYKHLTIIEEDERSKESLMLLPKNISLDIKHLKEGLNLKNKRRALLSAINIGLILFKEGV